MIAMLEHSFIMTFSHTVSVPQKSSQHIVQHNEIIITLLFIWFETLCGVSDWVVCGGEAGGGWLVESTCQAATPPALATLSPLTGSVLHSWLLLSLAATGPLPPPPGETLTVVTWSWPEEHE